MQLHSIPCAYLVFPVLLPLAEGVFLQIFVGAEDEHRSGGFESHTTFDAYNGVAQVHIAANGEARTDGFHGTDGVGRSVKCLAVNSCQLAFGEGEPQFAGFGLGELRWPCLFGQGLL